MTRYLETLFTYKWLFLVPVLAIPVIALIVTSATGYTYEISTRIWVQPPANQATSSARPSVAEREMLALQEWLATEAFRHELLERTGLHEAIVRGEWPVPTQLQNTVANMPGVGANPGLQGMLRSLGLLPPGSADQALGDGLRMVNRTISVTAEGNNLLQITYNGTEPGVGPRLVAQTSELYQERTLALQSQDAALREQLYARQLADRQEALTDAGLAYQEFLRAHPAPPGGAVRPAGQQAEFEQLQRRYVLAQTQYESTLARLEEVRIESETAIAGRANSFQVIDPPRHPSYATLGARTIVMTLVGGGLLGLTVGSLLIVLMTWSTNTVTTRQDIVGLVETPLIARAPLVDTDGQRPADWVRSTIARGA